MNNTKRVRPIKDYKSIVNAADNYRWMVTSIQYDTQTMRHVATVSLGYYGMDKAGDIGVVVTETWAEMEKLLQHKGRADIQVLTVNSVVPNPRPRKKRIEK